MRDIFGNELEQDESATNTALTYSVVGAGTTTISAAHIIDSTWQFKYNTQTKGAYTITLEISSSRVPQFPITVAVSPTTTDPSKTSMAGAGVTGATAGATAEFTVTPRDKFENVKEVGTDLMYFILTGAGLPSVVGSYKWDATNLKYDMWYTPIKAGSYSMTVYVGTSQIYGSPSTVIVAPAVVNGPSCTLEGTTYEKGIAGVTQSFTVQARDEFSNIVDRVGTTDYNFNGELTGPDTVTLTALYTSNGAYTMSYTPTVKGTYSMVIKLNSVAIRGSPFSVDISPNAASAQSTHTAPPEGTTGTEIEFEIQAKDANHNNLDGGGATFAVVMTCTIDNTYSNSGTVIDLGTSVYNVKITPAKKGTCSIAVTLGGSNIIGSPHPIIIRTNAASPAQSTAYVFCFSAFFLHSTTLRAQFVIRVSFSFQLTAFLI